MRKKALGWFKLTLKFSFSFLILFYMVYSGRLDLSVVRQGFSHIPNLLISIALMFLGVCLALYRWGLLMRGMNIHISRAEVVRYGMIGAFFNTTMPGAVSGDIIKTWYVVSDRKGQKKTPVLASVLLDRVMGVFGLVIVSASPIFLFWDQVWATPQLQHLAAIILFLFAGIILFFLYIMCAMWGPLAYLRQKVEPVGKYRPGRMALDAYDAWMSYRQTPGILVKSILISVVTHLSIVTVVILCSNSLGEQSMQLYQYFLLTPLGLLTTAIPIAPAGLGVGQVAFQELFKLAGSSHGAEVFTMFVTLQIFFNLTGVFFYLSSPKVVPAAADLT